MSYDIEDGAPTTLRLSSISCTSTSPSQSLILSEDSRFSTSTHNTHLSRQSPFLIHDTPSLGPVPAVIKSSNGNLFWADESCARRVGLSCNEARLFLQLQSGNYNYSEYSPMFHAFGEEKKNLQHKLRELKWWQVERRKEWEKRVEWLRKMEEPRLWLLYLMARKRRILLVACRRVLDRLRYKREEREERKRNSQVGIETSEESTTGGNSSQLESEGTQTDNDAQSVTGLTTDTLTHLVRVSQSTPRPASTHSHESTAHSHSHSCLHKLTSRMKQSEKSHSDPSSNPCPIFDRPLSATTSSLQALATLILPPQDPYLVLGYFPTSSLDPHETYISLSNPRTLFSSLHHAERSLRGARRFFSLKSLAGFGLYKCDIGRGAHTKIGLNEEEKMVLRKFYAAYKLKRRSIPWFGKGEWDQDVGKAWLGWVEKSLNEGKDGKEGSAEGAKGPLEGRWSLELVYDWSPYRLSAVVITPLLLSLIIGTWYMAVTGDVITAWTLALYIVTAAAAIVALLGIIGSLKDV
ncbi:hypothetical protein BCIN_14g05030 [Botrytis cinerea B05.10]|uniref:Uncharacterized protein n=1 Tax=Botryotinia fuckeliana (strain B05.10) TaxID=332648 RepID=A0A384K491_BOTFB|nr:hypothetical protein BCIN_14g05030 [Botrytis cinerea B05.10]ATZ57357.1 hypothetical protein BCIN_14g05030 [Botrytis cinerea B05.10]